MAHGAKNWGCTIVLSSSKGKNFRGFFGSFSQKTWSARAFRAPLVLQSLIEYRQQDPLNEAKKLFKHKTFDSSMGFPFSQELGYWIDTLPNHLLNIQNNLFLSCFAP